MTVGLSPWTAEAFDQVPGFVRERAGAAQSSSNLYERFDFWAPERTGEAVQDYLTGERHFHAALAFARANRRPTFLGSVVGGMFAIGGGPMELGFLHPLSRKATYGILPAKLSDDEVASVAASCGVPEENLRYGEAEAADMLQIARECGCPEVIEELMSDVVNRRMERGRLTFMWTVCGAAYLGAAN